ncbi:ecdysteroid 22-kinase family protein [Shewanella kaireitica]|uniref:ecdysteroid 22-kinase family protein n=1 Tax=Shewanella kaireitica TaxID=212021 RepID=UPI00200FA719|nr:ecdysteroid 22-kinase family protein [Shewanella kaireitica]MCL1096018.1 ecdysteroid 22-kinase family protein [Shewanella kaireitica]
MTKNIAKLEEKLSALLGTTQFEKVEIVQSLWSGYGEIGRYENKDKSNPFYGRFIVKHISPPTIQEHPRGWNGAVAHQRKLTSYNVEAEFYQNWANTIKPICALPKFIAQENFNEGCPNSKIIVMSDLDSNGYPIRLSNASIKVAGTCLDWLARFHALNLQLEVIEDWPKNLWPIGTYWYLDTRLTEYNAMEESELKRCAELLNAKLNNCQFKTLVHGDAKIANFCFSEDLSEVAAVDFQYVGAGCGMKDVIYFLGSCLDETTLEQHFDELIDVYFSHLKTSIEELNSKVCFKEVESEWRELIDIAWADFERFLAGWAPTHNKRTVFSQKRTMAALNKIQCS